MVNGIKGETPFVIIPKFDYVKACVPEYMHGSCLGVCKQFLKLFFTGKKSQVWFIGDKIPIFNARLINLKPPYEISRSAGAVDDLPNWEASMFRSFFCIISFCYRIFYHRNTLIISVHYHMG